MGQLMGLCDAGEVLQHVLDGEVHGDSRSRVTPANQIFKVLVLPDELVLHGVPHHLMGKRKGSGSEGDAEGGATHHVCERCPVPAADFPPHTDACLLSCTGCPVPSSLLSRDIL